MNSKEKVDIDLKNRLGDLEPSPKKETDWTFVLQIVFVVLSLSAILTFSLFAFQNEKKSPDYVQVTYSNMQFMVEYTGDADSVSVDLAGRTEEDSYGYTIFEDVSVPPIGRVIDISNSSFKLYVLTVTENRGNAKNSWHWVLNKNMIIGSFKEMV